ncbi:MAG: arylsulfatase [Novosphingobium sp.]|nr:arylsulfatase [Novosphingobium sp.]
MGKPGRYLAGAAAAACMASGGGVASAQQSREVLPIPAAEYQGHAGQRIGDSKPWFAPRVTAPRGAPNVIVILTDDVGFGATSAFGGPIATPALAGLARTGVRYNRFHTAGICSPTRAALLTGRNHHTVGMGLFPNLITGYPGYNGRIPRSATPIAEVLRLNGYSTAMFGKNHSTPEEDSGPTGPFDLWPTGMGFEYFYGFNGYDANHWAPQLYENTVAVETPAKPEYHLDRDMADRAIHWLNVQQAADPDKPFFLYYATGTAHSPHHAPKEWIARFKGQFDAGWDVAREQTLKRQKAAGIVPANTKLTPRPAGIPAWDTLTARQKRIYARMMEVYAASLAYSDHQIGRVIDAVKAGGEFDNTLILFVEGDNGASAEGTLRGTLNEVGGIAGVEETEDYLESMLDEMGGPMTFQHYPAGWAWAMNAPMQWVKQIAGHLGATRAGFVASWPREIAPSAVPRTQFTHVVDLYPTILEAAGLPVPRRVNGTDQQPLNGISFAYSFTQPDAPERHKVQYFELMGNRGIYADGWMASTTPKRDPWKLAGRPPGDVIVDYDWELYDLRKDFSQSRDLAAKEPAKLEELKAIFDREARANNVYPIDDSFIDRYQLSGAPPSVHGDRTVFSYPPDMPRLAMGVVPPLAGNSFSLSTRILQGSGSGANGVISAVGGRFGGWSFYVLDGRPVVANAISEQARHKTRLVSDTVLPDRNDVPVRFEVDYAKGRAGGPATVSIYIDGKPAGKATFAATGHSIGGSGTESMDFGQDTGTPVTEDYAAPFRFNGTLSNIEYRIKR